MNTFIICTIIIIGIFIVCYYINKFKNELVELNDIISFILKDMSSIEEIVDKTISIDCNNETIKHNLLTIKNIVSKYDEEI